MHLCRGHREEEIRADFGITYDSDALKLIDELRNWGINVLGVVITRFDNQPAATVFKNKLERRNIKVYTHRYTKGYPTDVDLIVSDEGYGPTNTSKPKNLWSSLPGRSGERETSHLPFPALSRLPEGFSPDTPSSRPSPSGTSL